MNLFSTAAFGPFSFGKGFPSHCRDGQRRRVWCSSRVVRAAEADHREEAESLGVVRPQTKALKQTKPGLDGASQLNPVLGELS